MHACILDTFFMHAFKRVRMRASLINKAFLAVFAVGVILATKLRPPGYGEDTFTDPSLRCQFCSSVGLGPGHRGHSEALFEPGRGDWRHQKEGTTAALVLLVAAVLAFRP